MLGYSTNICRIPCNIISWGLSLDDIEHAQGYIAHTSINIDELAFKCLDFAYNERTNDKGKPASYIDVTVKNDTPLNYNAVLLTNIYKPNEKGEDEKIEYPGKRYIFVALEVNSNMEKSASIELPELLEAGEYRIDLLIANDFVTQNADYYFVFESRRIQVSSTTAVKGIEDIRSNDAEPSGEWYDLNGRKFGKRPTAKGVYIYKGKKVVVIK